MDQQRPDGEDKMTIIIRFTQYHLQIIFLEHTSVPSTVGAQSTTKGH